MFQVSFFFIIFCKSSIVKSDNKKGKVYDKKYDLKILGQKELFVSDEISDEADHWGDGCFEVTHKDPIRKPGGHS